MEAGSTPVFNVDLDTDGLDDAHFNFKQGDTGITCPSGNETVQITGETVANVPFEGEQSIVKNCEAQCHN